MALALTLVALVVVGALVAGALFSGTEEQRMAENTRLRLQALGAADVAAFGAIDTWPAIRGAFTGRRSYPLDSAVPVPSDPGSGAEGKVYRLTPTLYLLDVTGHGGNGISQRLGVLVRIVPLHPNVQAALTLGEPLTGAGQAFANGTDSPPPSGSNWSDCGPSEGDVAGARSTVDTTALFGLGSTDYASLSRQAIPLAPGAYAPAPVVVGGECQTAAPDNWGDGADHAAPCGPYSPILWLKGDGTIVGGQGQGVLLVDGSLSVNGPFTFYGLIMVRGSLTAAGSAAVTVYGAVAAGRADAGQGGSMTVNWSSCALTQALLGAGVAALTRSRGWVQPY
jgi:hypothetical protein